MALALNRLTARQVQTITKPGRHADGGGLYLVVDPSGARRWLYMFRWKDNPSQPGTGRLRELGLGSCKAVTLAEARTAAEAARKLVAAGVDPIAAKRAAAQPERKVPTFGAVAEEHIRAHAVAWRNSKHRDQWRMTLSVERGEDGEFLASGYCQAIRDRPVDQITTEDILTILKPLWITKAETASRVRGRIEAVLNAAKALRHRSGENPAAWAGHLALMLPPRQRLQRGHHAAMPYADVPAFVKRLRLQRGMSAFALEFAILTAARSGEVRLATWAEVDLEAKLWTVPAARMKAGRVHRVPLSPRAVEILELVAQIKHGPDDLIFPGQRRGTALSDMSLTASLRRLKAGECTAHGFRSSFRDWAGDCTNFQREVIEAALAHAVGDAAEQAYRRGDALDKRRKLMIAWADFLGGAPVTNVVPMTAHNAAAGGAA